MALNIYLTLKKNQDLAKNVLKIKQSALEVPELDQSQGFGEKVINLVHL
jgi:hypothetical protein